MVTPTDRPNRPTDRPTNRQGENSAICLLEGWKIEGRDLQFNLQNLNQESISKSQTNISISTKLRFLNPDQLWLQNLDQDQTS